MELYHKQLKSVAELKREKKRIKLMRHLEDNNAEAVKDAKNADNPLASFASLAGDLISSKGTTGVLMSVAMPLLKPLMKKGQKGMFKLAKEVLGGYVKWKAIDMGITLAMRFIKSQKHKAEKKDD